MLAEKTHTERTMTIDKDDVIKHENNDVKLEWVDPDFTKLPIEETQSFPLAGPGADFTQAPYS